MKKFLNQIILFASLSLFVWFFCAFLVSRGVEHQSFAIDSSKTILVLGHSMGECSIDPAVIPRIANYCQSAEHYMQSYLKLRRLLDDNPQIDTVMLTFAPFTFGKMIDNGIFEGDYATHKMKAYYPLMDAGDLYHFWDKKILYTNLSPMAYIKSLITQSPYLAQLGGFLYLDRDKLQKDIELRKEPAPQIKTNKYRDTYQRLYLQKIVELCRQHNVTLMFIQTPIYHADQYYDMGFSDSVRKVVAPQIEMLDFAHLELPDSLYGDITHLNHRGAEAFSSILDNRLSSRNL